MIAPRDTTPGVARLPARPAARPPARRRALAAASAFVTLLAPAAPLMLGCQAEERVVRYQPWFSGLPGAESGTPAVMPDEPDRRGLIAAPSSNAAPDAARTNTDAADAAADQPDDARADAAVSKGRRAVGPDGRPVLLTPSVRDVMVHLMITLRDGEDDLLFDQLIAESTKEHFRAQGLDPRTQVLTYLRDHREDIQALFDRMPAAERSPGVMFRKSGRRRFEVYPSGFDTRDLRLRSLWVEQERGAWKLAWIS